jgi:hypothetical protein
MEKIIIGIILGLVMYKGYEFYKTLNEIESKINDIELQKKSIVEEIGKRGYAMYKYIQKIENKR